MRQPEVPSFIVIGYDRSRSVPVNLGTLNQLLAEDAVKPTQMVFDQLTGQTTNATAISGVILPNRSIFEGEAPPQFAEYPWPNLGRFQNTNGQSSLAWSIGSLAVAFSLLTTGAAGCAAGVLLALLSMVFGQRAKRKGMRPAVFVQLFAIVVIAVALILLVVKSNAGLHRI